MANVVTCQSCNGLGAQQAIAGHCFDIDGGLWHLPGECKAPECRGHRECCPPCPDCGGAGRIPVVESYTAEQARIIAETGA